MLIWLIDRVPSWDVFLRFLFSIAPLLLHVADKLFERISILGERQIRAQLNEDPRDFVRKPFSREENLLPAIRKYFDVEKDVHFILSVVLFSIINLLTALIEVRGSSEFYGFLYCVVAGGFVLLLFAIAFLLHIVREGLQPWLTSGPTTIWRWGAYGMLGATAVVVLFAMNRE